MEKRSNIAKALYMSVTTFFKKGWCFYRNVVKATIWCIKRSLDKGQLTFIEELIVTDTEDWGASVSVERCGKTLKELNSKELKASGTPACTAECRYYLELNGKRSPISPEKFFKLIPRG